MDSNNIEYMNDGSIHLKLDVKLYSRDAILHTTYCFTHKSYINLQKYEEKTALIVFSQKNDNNCDLKLLVKEFLNELIDQQIRVDINNETKDIRKMIISEAFAPLENIPESEE